MRGRCVARIGIDALGGLSPLIGTSELHYLRQTRVLCHWPPVEPTAMLLASSRHGDSPVTGPVGRSFGRSVVRSFGRSVVRSFGRSVSVGQAWLRGNGG